MARYKQSNKEQSLLIPLNFSEQLLPGTIEYAINDIVDNYIDTSIFDYHYNNETIGAKAYPPKILLKVILLAYSKSCYSSRSIEQLCKTNVLFISLTGNLCPDHSTIASFVSTMKDEVINIFIDILLRCAQLDLIGGETFALDGCKLPSNAAKEMSGTFKDLERKKEKLKIMCKTMLEAHTENDNCAEESLKKREEKYKKKIEKIDNFLKSHEPKKGARGRENKSNITDNESATMKSSHGIIQGYNGLAVVDEKHQIIVKAEAFGQGSEGNLLSKLTKDTIAAMKQLQPGWSVKNVRLLADSHYFSEDNCKFITDNQIDGYIPDLQFRSRDPRFPKDNPYKKQKKNLYGHEYFSYDERNNTYICPADKVLRYDGYHNNHGNYGRRYKVKDGSCKTCYRKSECLRSNSYARSVFITDIPRNKTFSEMMIEKIDTAYGRHMYSKRMGIVEPVFGNITYCKGLNRFTLRSKVKVNIQWLLYCCVHNIEKTLMAVT